MKAAAEVNFDGLVGPTHNYGDLSLGNTASMKNGGKKSNPRKAALQGIQKMRLCLSLGIPQAVFPPQERPDKEILDGIGYTYSVKDGLADLANSHPYLVPKLMSSSAMWAANMATVSPSADTQDSKVHITPANLSHFFHRSIEATASSKILRYIFSDTKHFVVHAPLPQHSTFGDEGAANHSRITQEYGAPGTHLFVYGRNREDSTKYNFPRRQTKLASMQVAQSHLLNHDNVYFLQQSQEAIDAGAFHNDVVSVANKDVVLMHEKTLAPNDIDLESIVNHLIVVKDSEVSLDEAVSSYLFNSQLVSKPDGSMALIAPDEINRNEATKAFSKKLVEEDNPITQVETIDVRQSMANGGGPACLRLRIVLTPEEIDAIQGNIMVHDTKLDVLEDWINKNYRDELTPNELSSPDLVDETYVALDELTKILELGSIYNFQKN